MSPRTMAFNADFRSPAVVEGGSIGVDGGGSRVIRLGPASGGGDPSSVFWRL